MPNPQTGRHLTAVSALWVNDAEASHTMVRRGEPVRRAEPEEAATATA